MDRQAGKWCIGRQVGALAGIPSHGLARRATPPARHPSITADLRSPRQVHRGVAGLRLQVQVSIGWRHVRHIAQPILPMELFMIGDGRRGCRSRSAWQVRSA